MNSPTCPRGHTTTFGTLDMGCRTATSHPAGDAIHVVIVGLGVIGAVHLDVLCGLPEASVDFVVDPHPVPDTRRRGIAQAATLRAALDLAPPPDLVVVATPTDTHLELVAEALEHTGAQVLSEKPLTREPAQLQAFEFEHVDEIARLRVVNHFAFSPEIDWAVRLIAAEGWGPPRRVISDFNDPYISKTTEQRASYVSPWVDSGSNQVSMLSRVCRGWVPLRQQVDSEGLRAVTELEYDGGRATLLANWWTGDSSKQTSLHWPTGVEVRLDHTAMTGFAMLGGTVVHHVGHDGSTGRKAAHYTAMYRALFAGQERDLLGIDLARSVAEVLAAGASAGSRITDGS
ncbi:MAG TPA: Gfo/Idh/MocA family oxidoreductase [Propionibacteriaceae bacterium]